MPKIAFLGFSANQVHLKVSQDETTVEDVINLERSTETEVPVEPTPTEPTTPVEPTPTEPTTPVEPTPTEPTPPIEPQPVPNDPTLLATPSGASLKLSSTRTTGTAPAGFFFSAVGAGFGVEDHYFDVRYKWDFGDPGWYTRHDTDDLPWGKYYNVDGKTVLVEDGSVPKGTSVKFLGNDKNIAYGPHVSHVFEKPGQYTVTCEVRKRGHQALVKTMTVTVKDPAVEFPGADTICVSALGDYTGAPAGAAKVKTWLEANVEAKKGPKKRILFRRGETHAHPSAKADRDISRTGGWDNIQYGAYGTGTSPRFTGGGFFLNANATGECAAWGLELHGPYDPRDPWKTFHSNIDAFFIYGKASMTTIWDCAASGTKNLLLVLNDGENIVIGNFRGFNWNNYGFFANRNLGYTGFCGVWLKQHPDTVIGPVKFETAPPYYQDHAPFRCSALANPVCFNLCDLRSVGSWAGYYQPCLRIGRSPSYVGPLIEEAVMDRIRGENGGMLGTGNSGSEAFPRRYLWDKIYSLNMPEGGDVFSPQVSGMHYRNTVAVIAKTPKVGTGNLVYWMKRDNFTAVDKPEIKQFGVTLMNSTLVDLRTAYPMTFDMKSMTDDYGFVRIENNVIFAPNKADSTETNDEPLDLTPMWAPTNPGIRYESTTLQTEYAVAPDTAAGYRPLSGSPALKGARGAYVAVDDFFGRIRGANTSRGAFD